MTRPRKSPLRNLRMLAHRLFGTRVATLGPVRLNAGPRDLPRSLRTAIFKGTYELPERELVDLALRSGDRVLEIGSGIGFISLLCAARAGARNVLSYEANPAMEPVIRGNYALNGVEPTLVMRAVTTDGQPIGLFQNANVISSSLIDRGDGAQRIAVESDPINAVIAAHRPDVIVMDVEGAEVGILTFADLAPVRAIVVETHDHIVGADNTAAMLAALSAKGFSETRRIHKNILLTRHGA